MIVSIDDKAKEKIKNWGEDIYSQFSCIINLISTDFFVENIDFNVINSNGNNVNIINKDDKNVYLSYEMESDCFPSVLSINDNNKCYRYEVKKNNNNIYLNLNSIEKLISNNEEMEISILGYGISIRFNSYNGTVINEIRGNNLNIDFYKLFTNNTFAIKNIDYILSCISGDIIDIYIYKYNKNYLISCETFNYTNDKKKVLVRNK